MFSWVFFVLLTITATLGDRSSGQNTELSSNSDPFYRQQPSGSFQDGRRTSNVDNSQYYRGQAEPVTYSSRQVDNGLLQIREPPLQGGYTQPRGNFGRGLERYGTSRQLNVQPLSRDQSIPARSETHPLQGVSYTPQTQRRDRNPQQVYDDPQTDRWPQKSKTQQFDYPQANRRFESSPSRNYGNPPGSSEIPPTTSSAPGGYVEPVQPRVENNNKNQPPQEFNWRDYVRDNPPAAPTTKKWIINGRASSKPEYANQKEEDAFNFFENALKRDSFRKGTHGLSFESGDIEEVQADKKEHLIGQMAWAGGKVTKKEVARRYDKYREDYGDIKPGSTLGVDAFQIFAELMAGAGNNEEWWEKQRRDGEERHQEWKRQNGML